MIAVSEQLVCTHCGAAADPGATPDESGRWFCCGGCEAVFALVERGAMPTPGGDASGALEARGGGGGRGYEEMDDASYEDAWVEDLGEGRRRTEVILEGLHCVSCVGLLERLPRVAPGVLEARVDLGRSRLTLVWDSGAARLSRIARVIDGLGYPCYPPRGAERERAARLEDRRMLVRVGVAGALMGNVMLIAVAMYGGLFDGIAEEHARLFRLVSAGLGTLSVVWPGAVFFRGGWASVRTGRANLDAPIAISLAVGTSWGLVNAVRGTGDIYFDSLATLVFLLLVGRWVQHRQTRRAASAVEALFSLTPSRARLVGKDGGVRDTASGSLEVGDVVEVRAGESLPADGTVEEGWTGEVDASMLTGESRPERVTGGDAVSAGTVCVASTMRVRVTASGEDTRAARLMTLVQEASQRRAGIVRLADRIAGWFTLVVMTLATVTVALWWSAGVETAVGHATALLIVCCPCALGLATPMVMTVTIGRLARAGVLVKGSDAIEKLARLGRLVLDKTGTVTEGGLRVVGLEGDEGVWAAVTALEAQTSQGAGASLRRGLGERGFSGEGVSLEDVRQIGGYGIEGVCDGSALLVGSARLMRERSGGLDERWSEWGDAQAREGRSPVFVARDGRVVAAAVLGDRVRDEAQGLLARWRARGWALGLLSGDRTDITSAVASGLGIEGEGEHTPEEKLARIREMVGERVGTQAGRLGHGGPVVMVGDGVNDAAALAAADVGVAVHGGAEASLEAADVAMQREGLEPIETLLTGSRSAVRRIRVCLGVSLGYNAVAATSAMGGLLNPLLAAVLMPASSLTVLAIALGAGKGIGKGGGAS